MPLCYVSCASCEGFSSPTVPKHRILKNMHTCLNSSSFKVATLQGREAIKFLETSRQESFMFSWIDLQTKLQETKHKTNITQTIIIQHLQRLINAYNSNLY